MAKPPPPPPSNAALSEVKAFGEAFEAALSHIDGSVDASPSAQRGAAPQAHSGDVGGPVYANDLEIRDVYTGPYTQVSDLPPSLEHLGAPNLKTLNTVALPGSIQSDSARVHTGDSSGLIKIVLLLAVVGAGFAFAFKLGLI